MQFGRNAWEMGSLEKKLLARMPEASTAEASTAAEAFTKKEPRSAHHSTLSALASMSALDVNTVDTSGKSRRWHESVSPASRTCSPSVSCRTRGKAALRFTRRFVCTGSHTATSHAIALDIRGRSRCPSVHLARSVRHLIEEHIMLGSRVKPSPLNSSSHGASHRTRPRSLS